MKPTGKFKTDFEKWYMELRQKEMDRDELENSFEDANLFFLHISAFKNLSFSMQYGVYVDFADNVKYDIPQGENLNMLIQDLKGKTPNRQKARQDAVEEFIKFYNKNFK